MSDLIPNDYIKLLAEIKERIRTAQYVALRAVNKELIALYWDIGQMIVTRQQDEKWRRSIVEKLAADLRDEFPGLSGFSARNLWYMRNFYASYCQSERLQPLVAEIGWTHNLIILERCKDDLQREFYIRMTRKLGWTKNVLIHQIDNQTYEKTLLNQTNFDRTVSEDIRAQAKLAVKDEYTFDFLELGDEYNERQLEHALLARVEAFLREMGGMFTFLGSQYHLEYALRESNKPIGVGTYRFVTELPAELKGQLPSPEQIARLLEGIE
jgi:predicted nuclease of restriction endonuclease-like (RecB) superfamily